MYRAKSFMCFGLIFGTILTMCDSLWAQKKVSIVIWFDKKQTFEAFQPVATLEKPFGKWINTDTFNVDVIIDSQVLAKFSKKKKNDSTNMTLDRLLAYKPTFLLAIRPIYASANIFSGSIERYENGEAKPTVSVFFGGNREDLAQIIFKKAKILIPESEFPRRCLRDGFTCDQITSGHRAQMIITGVAILWTVFAPERTNPVLPLPKSLPDFP